VKILRYTRHKITHYDVNPLDSSENAAQEASIVSHQQITY